MSSTAPIRYTVAPSPVGPLLLVGAGDTLSAIHFANEGRAARPAPGWLHDESLFGEASRQLAAYFAGELREFELTLDPQGTPFQLAVWRALTLIPYGVTTSYGELARRLGKPAAMRAVGAANGRNPLPIVVPCHRVIGADGSLVGFGGGLAIKRRLLEIEGVLEPEVGRRLLGQAGRVDYAGKLERD